MSRSRNEAEATIYTDGSCLGNPGPGGWAAIVRIGKGSREISGGFAGTTNNRMEIKALIEGLKALEQPAKVRVVTDSRYLHDALEKGWLRRWQANGWRTASKTPVKNRDLWEELLQLLGRHRVSMTWTRAHQGHKQNERCDQLAKQEAQKPDLPLDQPQYVADTPGSSDRSSAAPSTRQSHCAFEAACEPQAGDVQPAEARTSLEAVQHKLGYRFVRPHLLQTALTHSSYANESDTEVEHNERLEFLGDAVLELCISEELYKRYPDVREGDLTNLRAKLVSEPTLAEIGRRIHLQEHILLGKGEEAQGGRERDAVLSDALESLFGAVFLDGGFEASKKVILWLYKDLWPASIHGPRRKDFKSKLQEATQQLFKDRPKYSLVDSYGPEHAKTYHVRLTLPDGRTVEASASSLKKAEQMAAQEALHCLEKEQSS
jgi:ribonuclease-3